MNDATLHNQAARERLTRAFFHDYLLRCSLRQPDHGTPDAEQRETSGEIILATAAVELAPPAPFDLHELLPGQIRLLSQPDELAWVLLLRPWDASGNFLVVPFSPIPFPATDEEWLLGGRRAEYLEVLQLWNARTLHALFLRRSWRVATLSSAELQAANTLFKASLTGGELPDHLLQQTGLPIFNADDPRLEYKSESLGRLKRLDAADLHWNELCAEAADRIATAPSTRIKPPHGRENPAPTLLHVDFNAHQPSPLFDSLPLAADGQAAGSRCWDFACEILPLMANFCQANAHSMAPQDEYYARLDKSCPVRIKTGETPPLLWNLPSDCTRPDADALFFLRETQSLLGSGYLSRDGQESVVVLSDWIEPNHPDILAPDAVTIALANPCSRV